MEKNLVLVGFLTVETILCTALKCPPPREIKPLFFRERNAVHGDLLSRTNECFFGIFIFLY